MALRINTNVAALSAHLSMKKTDNSMSQSLGRLSTGLRINKAADDASGMAIADSLRSQANGLGQAVKNANDGISIVQTADGALEEATNIVNTIKTKSIQAAQDGQTFASRKIIQKDISKLLEEVDLLASSTSFNGKKLLSGEFTNKTFQVGSSSRETVGINIKSAETSKIGHVTTANLKVVDSGDLSLIIHSNEQDKDFELEKINMQYDNTAANGIGALAKAVNKSSDQTGITAQAVVQSSSNGTIKAGTITEDNGFKINGVSMGAVEVAANDETGTLEAAINQKSDQTGVTASTVKGVLTLNSADGRAIELKGDLGAVFGKNAESMSTFGELKITQTGSNSLSLKDSDAGVLTTTQMTTGTTLKNTSEMVVAEGSDLQAGGSLAAETKIGFRFATVTNHTMSMDSVLTAGSTIGTGTIIDEGTVLGGEIVVGVTAITEEALISEGSTLGSGTVLGKGTVLSTDIVVGTDTITAGSTLTADSTLAHAVVLQADMKIQEDSSLKTGTTLNVGTVINDDITTSGTANAVLTQDMTLEAGSTLASLSVLAAGSTLGTDFSGIAVGAADFTQDMELAAGSSLVTGAILEVGSTIGGKTTVTDTTLTADTTLSAGSTLMSGSTVAKGTYLTNDLHTADGTIKAGTTLGADVDTDKKAFLNNAMTLAQDSILKADTIIASAGGGTVSDISIEDTEVTRLQDIDVTTQEGAQIAIAVADSALAGYNDIRSDLGSTQNQLTSTIANLNVTQINVKSAESAIRDVDFAEESGNFSKLQILAQSGSYAMSQANSSSQTVMSLLQ